MLTDVVEAFESPAVVLDDDELTSSVSVDYAVASWLEGWAAGWVSGA